MIRQLVAEYSRRGWAHVPCEIDRRRRLIIIPHTSAASAGRVLQDSTQPQLDSTCKSIGLVLYVCQLCWGTRDGNDGWNQGKSSKRI